jgi:hypothetical protein
MGAEVSIVTAKFLNGIWHLWSKISLINRHFSQTNFKVKWVFVDSVYFIQWMCWVVPGIGFLWGRWLPALNSMLKTHGPFPYLLFKAQYKTPF